MVMSRGASDIYFCGNCEEGFATKLVAFNDDENGDAAMDEGARVPSTRLICVPKFSETGEAVLVNLKTLEVELLRFKAGSDNKSD
jgi:DNA polymerase delta subunit 2